MRLRILAFLVMCFISVATAAEKNEFVWGIWYNSYQQPHITFKEKHDRPMFAKHIAFFREIGINRIYFLVKFPTGHVFYDSKIAPRHPQLDWDPFAFLVEECRRQKIEIYPYVNVLPEGGYNDKTKQYDVIGPYLEKYPQFAMQDRAGKKYSWASPAIEDVVKYELAIIEEIVKNYKIDGLQLDRIRYPNGDVDYNPQCVALYQKKYGKKIKADDYDWVLFRQRLLFELVKRSQRLIKRIDPKVKVSAAVFPRPYSAAKNQLQPWGTWCRAGLLDEVVPMTYYRDVAMFRTFLAQDQEVTPPDVPLLAGIGSFFIKDVKVMQGQMDFALQQAVQGIVFFNGYHLLPNNVAAVVKKYTSRKATRKGTAHE